MGQGNQHESFLSCRPISERHVRLFFDKLSQCRKYPLSCDTVEPDNAAGL